MMKRKKEMNTMLSEDLPDMVIRISNENEPSWNEMVAKEVDTKMSSFSAENTPQQEQMKIIQDKHKEKNTQKKEKLT